MASEWEELEKLSKDELIIEADKIVGGTRAPNHLLIVLRIPRLFEFLSIVTNVHINAILESLHL